MSGRPPRTRSTEGRPTTRRRRASSRSAKRSPSSSNATGDSRRRPIASSSLPARSRSCSSRSSRSASEGDEVIYPDPGFPMYESITSFAGATPVPYALREENRFRLDPEELASLVTDRTKLLILNSPHNPCGSALTRDEADAIARARDRAGPRRARRRGLLGAPLRRAPRERPCRRRHERTNGLARRLVEDVRDDGLASRVRSVPAVARRTGRAPGHQLGLVHVGVQPVRGDRRARGTVGHRSRRWSPSSAAVATSSSTG